MDIVYMVGRFNPPHEGHGMLFSELRTASLEEKLPAVAFIVEQSLLGKDRDKNPLTGHERKVLLSGLYPDIRFIVVNSAYEAQEVMDVMGLRPAVLVSGGDRTASYERMVKEYWGESPRVRSFYRSDVSDDVDGMSATKLRKAVRENDFTTFSRGFIDPSQAGNFFELLRLRL